MAQNQAYLFLIFTLTGIVIGILFDFFRILRRNIKTSNIITYIEDILFWILTGILILYNIWYFNNGEIRIYMFFAIILGDLIYLLTLSEALIKLFSIILQIIIKVFRMPYNILKNLTKKIITKIGTIYVKITKKFANKRGNFENVGE